MGKSTGKLNLGSHCHTSSNRDDDRFVGIKADTVEGVQLYFPLGYDLGKDDYQIRKDIQNLIKVLLHFKKEEKIRQDNKLGSYTIVNFPLFSYLEVIKYYLTFGYYTEKEKKYITSTRGKTDWRRSIKKQSPLVCQSGNFIYTNRTVIHESNNSDVIITKINKYCVYESFKKLGWLFISTKPIKADIPCSSKQAEILLRKYLLNTNADNKKILFKSMIDIIRFEDEHKNDQRFYFGTYEFEWVWENLINQAFGIDNKEKFLPRTRWVLEYGAIKDKKPLIPDTIMIYKNNCYVLDAKYYHFGITGNPDHLPNGTDINKQITYGEYVRNNFNDQFNSNQIFNAFIMPFNKNNNLLGIDANIANVGEAIGDWKNNTAFYERVQGILIDTRYLMLHYLDRNYMDCDLLATCIEKVKDKNNSDF